MAIAQAAIAAGSSLVKYAPAVYNKGMQLVASATGGRVKSAGDIAGFVKNDPRKFSVVAGALATAGVSANDLVPADIAALNPQLAAVRASVEQIAARLRDQYDQGSDRILEQSVEDTARDVLRKQRVEAVLDVYGTPEKFFLCHPTGEIPRSDFSWYKSMGFRR